MGTPVERRVLRDLAFAAIEGYRPLSLDLHLPETVPAPLVVFVHGGGWRRGSRAVMAPTLTEADPFGRITAAGLAVASIDYRLSAEATFPAQVDDVRAALEWLRGHADEVGVDRDRVVLWGESAGATLAALVALDPASEVRGLVDWYGPADLPALSAALGELDDPTTREAGWLGGPVASMPDRARAASPVHHVHRDAPPTLIAHGLADRAVPPAQSEAFAAALRGVGVPVDLSLVPGGEHLWQGDIDRVAILDHAIRWVTDLLHPKEARA